MEEKPTWNRRCCDTSPLHLVKIRCGSCGSPVSQPVSLPLGFTVHPSTLLLMREIGESGELSHLVPERVWSEIESAMSTGQPGVFVEVLRQCGALSVLLPEVDILFGVPQPEKYHPEIDTGVHVIMAMNLAARLGWPAGVVFALLLHDLGKGITDPADWPSHIGHERAGVPMVDRVCERFRVPGAYRDLALKVCALHLRCHRLMEMKPSRVMALLEEADLLRRPLSIWSRLYRPARLITAVERAVRSVNTHRRASWRLHWKSASPSRQSSWTLQDWMAAPSASC